MMLNTLVILLAVILLGGLLHCEKRRYLRGRLFTKTILSSMFLFAALIQPHQPTQYSQFLIIGLSLCLLGDVLLALPQEKAFIFGLGVFLLAHLFYIIAFFITAHMNLMTPIGTVLTILISVGAFLWLKHHLGSLKIPVLLYVIVISIMLIGAWSVLGDRQLSTAGRVMLFAGALSFYFSDLFVARDRFIRPDFSNSFFGLPLYYFGQFLIAFSVSFLK